MIATTDFFYGLKKVKIEMFAFLKKLLYLWNAFWWHNLRWERETQALLKIMKVNTRFAAEFEFHTFPPHLLSISTWWPSIFSNISPSLQF